MVFSGHFPLHMHPYHQSYRDHSQVPSFDNHLPEKTALTPTQICMLDLCLNTMYFLYRECSYRQKTWSCHGFTSFLHSCQPTRRRLNKSFRGSVLSQWLRYVDDSRVKIQTIELEAFSAHLNNTDKYGKFMLEVVKENSLASLDCAVKIEEDGKLSIEVYRKPTDTNQYPNPNHNNSS